METEPKISDLDVVNGDIPLGSGKLFSLPNGQKYGLSFDGEKNP